MKKIVLFIIIILSISTLMINLYSLVEAYGSGAPYYSKTTNMDKWSNPIPLLLMFDIAIITLVYLGIKFLKR